MCILVIPVPSLCSESWKCLICGCSWLYRILELLHFAIALRMRALHHHNFAHRHTWDVYGYGYGYYTVELMKTSYPVFCPTQSPTECDLFQDLLKGSRVIQLQTLKFSPKTPRITESARHFQVYHSILRIPALESRAKVCWTVTVLSSRLSSPIQAPFCSERFEGLAGSNFRHNCATSQNFHHLPREREKTNVMI